MEEILNKYYEYFLKNKFTDKESIDDNSEFYKFYNIIIGEKDMSNDLLFQESMKEFLKFYSYRPWIKPRKRASTGEIKRFNEKNLLFKWFDNDGGMVKTESNSFIYSIFSGKNHYMKAYLSVKPQDYINTCIKLQSFISNLIKNNPYDTTGQCKFRTYPSNDAIVMRFSCEEHYKEFLQFLDENPEINESFDTPNLFLPRDDHGLSIITDNGGSYNYFVTRMIWDYMFDCRDNNKKVSINELTNFIDNYDYSNDKMINSNDKDIVADYKYILTSKLTGVKDQEIIDNIFNKTQTKTKILK